MNDVLNAFRAGVIAERQFAHTALAARFTVTQWHARCVHLSQRPDIGPEVYGRLAVALHILEALDSNETDQ